MELVSKVKFQKAMRFANQFQEYREKFFHILQASYCSTFSHDLLSKREKVARVAFLVIAGDRGLCGSYNAQIVEETIQFREKFLSEEKEVDIHIIGKKAFSAFSFKKIPVKEQYPILHDTPSFSSIVPVANNFIDLFQKKHYDEVWILYTNKMRITKELLLPVSLSLEQKEEQEYLLFAPVREKILENLVPHSIQIQLYSCLLYAIVSEQTARMLAMKQASENADSMIKELTKQYNRARQAQITREMLEILAGVEAKDL